MTQSTLCHLLLYLFTIITNYCPPLRKKFNLPPARTISNCRSFNGVLNVYIVDFVLFYTVNTPAAKQASSQ